MRGARAARTALAAALCWGLAACGDDPDPDGDAAPRRTVTALEETFTVAVPEEWTEREDELGAPVVVAVGSPDGSDRLLAQYFRDPVGAENEAIRIGGRLSGRNVFCERVDGTEVFGEPRTVFDCPLPGNVRKVLVPVEGDRESVLLLVQTVAASLDGTAGVVGPIVESFAWRD